MNLVNKKTDKKQWLELITGKDKFQSIVKLLLDFEERSGKVKQYLNPELHNIRRAISLCDYNDLQIWIRNSGAFVYEIIVCGKGIRSSFSTTWLHEDGIYHEREVYANDPDHPVHNILCITDLFNNNCENIHLEMVDEWVVEQMDGFEQDVME